MLASAGRRDGVRGGCHDALFNLRQRPESCGEAVKARVKTDTVVRSYHPSLARYAGAPGGPMGGGMPGGPGGALV